MLKTISNKDNKDSEKVESELIIYGNDYFISDQPLQTSQSVIYMFELLNNEDLGLNSIAYLTNNDQEITIRKSYSDTVSSFTATDAQKSRIITAIFMVPIVIIIIGIVVWIIRKYRV